MGPNFVGKNLRNVGNNCGQWEYRYTPFWLLVFGSLAQAVNDTYLIGGVN